MSKSEEDQLLFMENDTDFVEVMDTVVVRRNISTEMSNTNSNRSSYDLDYPSLEAVEPQIQIILIIMYSLTALLSFVGNTTVIAVLLFGKRSSKGIRHFLINLAISDITMAIFSIPFTYTSYMYGRWIFHTGFCPIVQFMQHVSVTVSVYTLTAIGIDRYYAIMHPLKTRWTKSRWFTVLVSIWLVAIAMSSTLFVYGQAKQTYWDGKWDYVCREDWPEETGKLYTICVFVVTFAWPLVILGFTYASIAWKMWKHTSPGNADAERDQHQLLAKRKVIKMLALVVALFAFCWLPLQVYLLLLYVQPHLMSEFGNLYDSLPHIIFFTCHWLAMANSFVNPIIYCFMSETFWDDLRQIFLQCSRFLSIGKKKSIARGRCLGSFRSTTYVLSFRTTSAASSHGATIYMKRMGDGGGNDKLINEDGFIKGTSPEKQDQGFV